MGSIPNLRVRIAPPLRRALIALAQADDLAYGEFRDEFSTASSAAHLHEALTSARALVGDSIARDLVYGLLSLSGEVAIHGIATDDLSLALEALDGLPFDEDGCERLLTRLVQLLSFSGLEVLARALNVLNDERVLFASVRIVTDIRPVFDPSTEPSVGGIGVIHHLTFECFDTEISQPVVIRIAMDDEDLAQLSRTIERERMKHEGIEAIIKSSGVPKLSVMETKPNWPQSEAI